MAESDFLASTRASYDALAAEYAPWVRDELLSKPVDRGVLAAFAELVLAGPGGLVADVGCGTGRVTAHLASLGLDAFGIDLSPRMVSEARRAYPPLRFAAASMLDLPLAPGSLGGVLAWYSTIHVPDSHLPVVFTGFRRVLAPGGYLQLGFQSGEGIQQRTEALGHDIDLTFHRRTPDQMAALLADAGFDVRAQVLRAPDADGPFPEKSPQAFVLARTPLL